MKKNWRVSWKFHFVRYQRTKENSAHRLEKRKLIKLILELLAKLALFLPLRHQPGGAFLSLRGTSRKTKLIEIHENFIRNSEASVKPGIALHIKQFSLVFFSRVDTHVDAAFPLDSLYSSYTRGQLWEKFVPPPLPTLIFALLWQPDRPAPNIYHQLALSNSQTDFYLTFVFPHFSLLPSNVHPPRSRAISFASSLPYIRLPYIYIYIPRHPFARETLRCFQA